MHHATNIQCSNNKFHSHFLRTFGDYLSLELSYKVEHYLCLHKEEALWATVSIVHRPCRKYCLPILFWIMSFITFLDLICFIEVSSWCSNCWSSLTDNESSCSPIRCLKSGYQHVLMHSTQRLSKVCYLWLLCKTSNLALSLAYSLYQLPYVPLSKISVTDFVIAMNI